MKETIKDWLILGFWLLFASPMIIGLVLMTIILLIIDKIYNLFNKKHKNTMTKQVNIHIINNYIYFTSNDDLGINKPFYGYCWNWWDKIHYFKNGLNENARGRKGIEKIIATNNPEYKDLPSIPKEWLIDKCKTYYDKEFLSSTEEYYDFDKNNFPKTINLEIYESYSDGKDYQLYDYKLKNNHIVIVEKDKQETWQDILAEYSQSNTKLALQTWLQENFEVPKRK